MFARRLSPPTTTFFLLGPRGTGKSTWLKHRLKNALYLDLLKNDLYLPLLRSPEKLRDMVLGQWDRKSWVVLDEVQRIPSLLNEVHHLIEEHGVKFALSGSSARKLKKSQANLLAGRAIVKQLLPLTFDEMKQSWDLKTALRFGTLPIVVGRPNDTIDVLEAYVGTYLKEEIKEEALTRKVDSFSRFLEVAGLANAQVTNLLNVSRDAEVPRATVTTYFEILRDTLIGDFLPAFTPRAKIKEVAHPKFYFFDCGAVRAVQGRLRDEPSPEELGHLLETYVLHELKAHMSYANIGGQILYWRTPNGSEIDFIWKRGNRVVAIEVKASQKWKTTFEGGFKSMADSKQKIHASFGVYLGSQRLKRPFGQVLPLKDFLEQLSRGLILEK